MYVGLFIYFWSVFPMGAQAEHPARAPMWCHNSSSRLDAYTQPLSNLRAEKAQNPQSISSWWVWIIVLFNNKVKSSSGRIQHKLSSALCKVLPLKHRLATHSSASTSTDQGLITIYLCSVGDTQILVFHWMGLFLKLCDILILFEFMLFSYHLYSRSHLIVRPFWQLYEEPLQKSSEKGDSPFYK